MKARRRKTSAHRNPPAKNKKTNVASLTHELHEALAQQAATAEVLKVISSSPGELEPVFQTILKNATRLCEAKFGNLFLYDGTALRMASLYGAPAAWSQVRGMTVIVADVHPDVPIARVTRTKSVVHVPDGRKIQCYIDRDPTFTALIEIAGARTVLGVPLLKDRELIGVFTIYRHEVKPFTAKQIELVTHFAAQAVIAIENARLLTELRQSLQQQTATSDILEVISNSPTDSQPAFDAIVQSGLKLFPNALVIISLPDGNKVNIVAVDGADKADRDAVIARYPLPLSREYITSSAILDRREMDFADVRDTPADLITGKQNFLASGNRAITCVPMMRGDSAIGALSVIRRQPGAFSDEQRELLRTFARQAVIAIENTRLFYELRESLQQQTATADVLKVISSSPGNLEPVFDAILGSATEICEARFGTLNLYDGNVYQTVALHNAPPGFAARRGAVIHPHPDSGLFHVARTKSVVHIDDIRTRKPYLDGNQAVVELADLAGARTLLIVPMVKESDLIGTISIYRQEVRPFSDKQIELVKNFASQAVIAIENARLLSELRETLQQQTATADVLKVISRSAFDLQTVLQTLVESAARLCDADRTNITREKNGAFYRAEAHGFSREFLDYAKDVPIKAERGSAFGRAFLEGRAVHIPDVLADPEYTYLEGQRLGDYRTVLSVPMLREGVPIGVLSLTRSDVRPFTDKQIELATTFADQAVIAIENVRLLNELQESLQQQTATANVLKVISSSPGDLKPVFEAMLVNAMRICEANFGHLLLYDGEGFHPAYLHDVPPAYREIWEHGPVRPGPNTGLARLARDKQVFHIPDITADVAYADRDPLRVATVELAGARTFLGVPMLKDNQLVGAIVIYRREVKPFTDKQIELVKNFAAQAVIAIENARLLKELRQRTTDLSQSLEDLRTAQDRLVQTEKLASLGQLTAGIAHEIKNPLNFVNNFSAVSVELIDELRQALAAGNLDSKLSAEVGEIANMLQGNLDKVVQHGKRADAIVKNMLLHSRQGSGDHRPVDINSVVEESLNLAYHGARAEKQGFNITVEKSFDPGAGEVDLFPQEITRALLNLISNGFYAATKRRADTNGGNYEPTLTAATRNLGDRVEITIRDNGTGIPSDVKDQMFNPFFTTKPAGEGTGLGLSISHDIIVKQHAGSIEVDTQPGAFTEFRIVLPRAPAFPAAAGGR